MTAELEQIFLAALKQFVETANDDTQFALFRAYCRLLQALSENAGARDALLGWIISALVDALDAAPEGMASEVLYLYTFRDFLETYGSDPVIQAVIRDYVNSDRLNKLPLRTALKLRMT